MSRATAVQKAQQVLGDNYVLEPPVDVYTLASNYGIEIREQSFPEDFGQVSGFINIEGNNPVMYINGDDPDSRKNFTAAHEFGHWLLHETAIRQDPERAVLYRIALGVANDDPLEKEANVFAAELLVPTNMLKNDMQKPVKELAKKFDVSADVIGYRKVNIAHVESAEKSATVAAK